jgi:hypothetical protein
MIPRETLEFAAMSFPKTVIVSGTNNSPWNVINAPMWGPVQVTFNVTQSGATSWSIQLTNTNILANTHGSPSAHPVPWRSPRTPMPRRPR